MTFETALVHFEKGLPDCEGIYKAINNEAAVRLARISRTSTGRAILVWPVSVRQSCVYDPHHMVEVFSMKRDS